MLKNKVVVITGGAGLLGREFSTSVAKNGGISVIADLDFEVADRVANVINLTYPGCAVATQLDITNPKSVDNLIKSISKSLGRIDAVVNTAYPRNKNWGRKLEEVTYNDFCENLSMHLGGYFLIAQRFALYFKTQGFGNIVNIASIYGVIAPRFELYTGTSMTVAVEYVAIKSAIIQLTRYFAQYFKHDSVRCNTISPGGIFDNQPEAFLQRYNEHCGNRGMLKPNDITGVLMFLLSDASLFITGQNLVIDDGFTL